MIPRTPNRPAARRSTGGPAASAALLALLALTAGPAGCGGEPEPVARLTVAPESIVLGYPQAAEIAATWEMTAPLGAGARPVVFVHLLGDDGAVLRTFDVPLEAEWRSGESATVPIRLWQSALVPPLDAGSYRLTLGLYDPSSGERWRLATAGEEVDEGEYAVARVEAPPAVEAPSVVFTGTWMGAESTGDRQAFVHHWLREDGSFDVVGLSGPTTLGLRLVTPRPGEGEAHLVLEEGAARPEAIVSSQCSAERATFAGPAAERIELVLEPPAEGGDCAVTIDLNFVFVYRENLVRRALAVERITLTPEPFRG